MRTHYCGEITESLIDESVLLYGWVKSARNHGGLIFIDLRDRTGFVQLVAHPEQVEVFAAAETVHDEYVLKIQGKVMPRPEGMINKIIPTGKVEVHCSHLEILAKAEALPFQDNASEDLKLKYRYLDIRRDVGLTNNLMIRAKAAQVLRHFLDKHGFIEIETPVLTKSTPEGARDYLVPSRNFPGSFYALPQSPQIFKQLLMMAGMDRYYQIVRCFRDEDLRADRQPEFTQVDIETSFMQENELRDLIEEMIKDLFVKVMDIALPEKFPVLSYDEAVTRYGIDRPDLRIPLELIDIGDLVKSAEFKVFADVANAEDGRVVALKLPNGGDLSRKQLDDYTKFVEKYGAKGLANIKVLDLNAGVAGLRSAIIKFLSPKIVADILKRVEAKDGDVIFLAADKAKIVNNSMGALRVKLGEDFNLVEGGWRPIWIVDFPMFERDGDKWTFLHHPFTRPRVNDPLEMKNNPGKVYAHAYDLVLNGLELGGGSLRISDYKMQLSVLDILGIDEKRAEENFGHLIEALKYGCPPHGGIAFGFDRIIMVMAQAKSIRDVIAFPKTLTAACPLTNAPSPLANEQLKELGIKVIESETR